jgi:predicted glycosyltransferase
LFSAKHWVDMIDPDELTPESLAECISSHLSQPNAKKPSTLPNLSGAAVAAKHTLAVLAPKKDRDRA